MRENMHQKTSHSGIDWQHHEWMHICAWLWIVILAQELRVDNRRVTSENGKNNSSNETPY
jgi:hypothetical protein